MPEDLDRYYTPIALARALVHVLADDHWGDPPDVLEPHAGGAAFLDSLEAMGCEVTASDIDPNSIAVSQRGALCREFLQEWDPEVSRPSWIVGNPPYGEAEEHTRHALRVATVGVAFLLRLGMLESRKRIPFWAGPGACLHTVYVLAQRPSFVSPVTRRGATDSAAYGWFVWRQGHTGPARIVPGLSWR